MLAILNNDILKVGIIGCGLIGNKRAAVIKNDPTSVLRAASDVNVINGAALLQQCGASTGSRACRDWRDMLNEEKLDAVIVATPNKYLKKISLWALQRGINVLCEKPLGRNLWESERMVKVGRDGGYTAKVSDACVIVPTVNPETVTPHTEAFQAVVWHLIVSHPAMKINEMKWESVK